MSESFRKSSIDLLNVDYDDVLQLYRGWRRSEGMLKDKDKELSALRTRIEQLQASHGKFRGQILALEGVKELTITLQSNCNVLYQENVSLADENKSLEDNLEKLKEELASKMEAYAIQSKALHESELELSLFKGRFEQLSKSHMELEKIAAEEQANRLSCEARLVSLNEVLSSLRNENNRLLKEIDHSNLRMSQCDHELAIATEQLNRLAKEVAIVTEKNEKYAKLDTENALLKGDISRMVRLLAQQQTSKNEGTAKRFISQWKDSESMAFIGLCRPKSANSSNPAFKPVSRPPRVVESKNEYQEPFYDSVFDDHDEDHAVISEDRLNEIKEQFNGDPYPLTESLDEELDSWIPRDAAVKGLSFFTSRLPNTPHHILTEFLRSLNKVWQKREKRKVQRIKEAYISQIHDLKRQIQNAKPYKGVIAEKKIRMLKNQIDREREKHFHGRPIIKDAESDFPEDRDDVITAPRDQLLHASLSTLETLGKHMNQSNLDQSYRAMSRSGRGSGKYPTEEYLQGAMWLGRNLVMLNEEMSERMESFRSKVLKEISYINEDKADQVRTTNRLSLLAGSSTTEAVEIAMRFKQRTRDILQGVSAIQPGDISAMQLFLQNLPIDSLLEKSNLTSSYGAVEPSPVRTKNKNLSFNNKTPVHPSFSVEVNSNRLSSSRKASPNPVNRKSNNL